MPLRISFIDIARICYCVGRLGSVCADIISPVVFSKTGSLSWAFWVGTLINVVSFLFVCCLNIIDKMNDQRRKKLRYLRKTNEIKYRF